VYSNISPSADMAIRLPSTSSPAQQCSAEQKRQVAQAFELCLDSGSSVAKQWNPVGAELKHEVLNLLHPFTSETCQQ
jgi:hypothetical protein